MSATVAEIWDRHFPVPPPTGPFPKQAVIALFELNAGENGFSIETAAPDAMGFYRPGTCLVSMTRSPVSQLSYGSDPTLTEVCCWAAWSRRLLECDGKWLCLAIDIPSAEEGRLGENCRAFARELISNGGTVLYDEEASGCPDAHCKPLIPASDVKCEIPDRGHAPAALKVTYTGPLGETEEELVFCHWMSLYETWAVIAVDPLQNWLSPNEIDIIDALSGGRLQGGYLNHRGYSTRSREFAGKRHLLVSSALDEDGRERRLRLSRHFLSSVSPSALGNAGEIAEFARRCEELPRLWRAYNGLVPFGKWAKREEGTMPERIRKYIRESGLASAVDALYDGVPVEILENGTKVD